jgi:hypothetical protein
MRLSQDADTYRARGIIRRDYRSARDLPEISRTTKALTPVKHHERTIACESAPNGTHVPERFVIRQWRDKLTRDGDPWVRINSMWAIRCRYCHTEHLAVKLLGPVADLIDREDLRRLLAFTWCQQGHLFQVDPAIKRTVTDALGTFSYTVRAAEKWCVMCGHSSHLTHAITDPALLAAAAVPLALATSAGRGPAKYQLHSQRPPSSWARNVTFTEEPAPPPKTVPVKRVRRRNLPPTEVPILVRTSA